MLTVAEYRKLLPVLDQRLAEMPQDAIMFGDYDSIPDTLTDAPRVELGSVMVKVKGQWGSWWIADGVDHGAATVVGKANQTVFIKVLS